MAHHHEHHHCDTCSHEHHHEENSLKHKLWLIAVTSVLLVIAVLIEHGLIFNYPFSIIHLLLIYLIPYLLIGHETLYEAWEGITEGDMFNEHFLMSVATIGALCIGFLPGAESEFPRGCLRHAVFPSWRTLRGLCRGEEP